MYHVDSVSDLFRILPSRLQFRSMPDKDSTNSINSKYAKYANRFMPIPQLRKNLGPILFQVENVSKVCCLVVKEIVYLHSQES